LHLDHDPQDRRLAQQHDQVGPIVGGLNVGQVRRFHLAVFGSDYPTPDATGVRDFLHVEDLASAHLCGLECLRAAGRSVTLNVGYGHGYSVREVLRMLEAVEASLHGQ
jgi:UDP-glucose 4-epimerase